MLATLKFILLAVVVGSVAYAAFVLFPRKLKLLRRVGMGKTNSDLLALAKAGDSEAVRLVRSSRGVLWLALPSVLLLAVIQALFRH